MTNFGYGYPFLPPPPKFDPLTLSPVIWVRPDELVAVGDTNPITTWTNLGSGGDLTSASTNRPVVEFDAIDGLPAATFDGGNDYMLATIGILTQPVHVFIVAKTNSAGYMFDSQNAAARNAVHHGLTSANRPDAYAGTVLVGPDSVSYDWHIFEILFNGANSMIAVDNFTFSSQTAGAQSMDEFTLGDQNGVPGTTPLDGSVAELFVFDGEIIGNDLTNLYRYLG